MLAGMTILIILATTYALFMQGFLGAFCTMVNVFLAGLVAFNFWEPMAAGLGSQFSGNTMLQGLEDWICLLGLFLVTLLVLRILTNSIAYSVPDFMPAIQQGGAALCGLLTGYLLAGFLTCLLQTLPFHDNFLGFDAQTSRGGGIRRYLPPDRVLLALMRRASMGPLSTVEVEPFDPRGSFELRYSRHRRYGDSRDALPYQGEDYPIEHAPEGN